MKTSVAAALFVGMSLWAGTIMPVPERTVQVCMQRSGDLMAEGTAQAQASEIFARIGIRVVWRDPRSCRESDGLIKISLRDRTPQTLRPNALAYALPYEGTHIVVFYDRVQGIIASIGTRNLLAYVLVHELTHILEGTEYHAGSGIMKAGWNIDDYSAMALRSLDFSATDVALLHPQSDRHKEGVVPPARAE
jgi:hypothetical protein